MTWIISKALKDLYVNSLSLPELEVESLVA
jgi:hypothetical protein